MKHAKDTLWLKLGAGAETDAPLEWVRVDASGRVRERGEAVPEALAKDLPCHAVVAADRVTLGRYAPPGGRRLTGAALAFALEERLAEAPESVHAVSGPVGADGQAAFAVVDRAWFAEVLDRLAEAGRTPERVWAEPSLVPPEPETGVLVWQATPFLVLPEGAALGLPAAPEPARALIELALARSAVRTLVLRTAPGAGPAPDLPSQAGAPYEWATVPTAAGLDLRQGDFARRAGWTVNGAAWRPVAWLALALVAMNGLGLLAQSGSQAWSAQRLAQSQRAAFAAAFPEVKVVIDPVRQMRGKVAELSHRAGQPTEDDLLPLLAAAGKVLPATARQSARGLRYRPGVLTLLLPAGLAVPDAWAAAGLSVARRASEQPGIDELIIERRVP